MPKDSSPHWIWHSSAARAALYVRGKRRPDGQGRRSCALRNRGRTPALDLDLAKAQVRSALANQRYHRDVH